MNINEANGRWERRSSQTRKGVENPPDVARMFESVSGMPSFRLVTHQLCQSQRAENIAGPRDAAADGLGNFPGAHLFSIHQQGNHGKGDRIAEEPAQPRLPVGQFFHGSDAYHVFAIAKTWQQLIK
jgi:hypothetical protein